MSNLLPVGATFTEQEYIAHEEHTDQRHEYFEGKVLLLPDSSLSHADCRANILAALWRQLCRREYHISGHNQRLKIPATGLITYPDILVVQKPILRAPELVHTLVDANVLMEIVSPTTREHDTTIKFNHYKQLPSLLHYLLVDQDRVFVEHRSLEGDVWNTRIYTEKVDVVELPEVGCRLTLGEIYDEVL